MTNFASILCISKVYGKTAARYATCENEDKVKIIISEILLRSFECTEYNLPPLPSPFSVLISGIAYKKT